MNSYIILLIAIVVFLLFMMYNNRETFENFRERGNYNTNKYVDSVLNTVDKDNSFEDTLAKVINKENISNLKVVVPSQSQTTSIPRTHR